MKNFRGKVLSSWGQAIAARLQLSIGLHVTSLQNKKISFGLIVDTGIVIVPLSNNCYRK
jgi:hypothetical protein